MIDLQLATHNGEITITNPATGQHRTFRIRTQPKDAKFAPGKRIVSLLTGSDNTSSYRSFAFVDDDGVVRVWRAKQGQNGQLSDFDKFADLLNRADYFQVNYSLEYLFSGHCIRCNRLLTEPESIRLGIGPVCRNLVG